MRRLLLLSSARGGGTGYLEYAEEQLASFLPDGVPEVVFIPYAAVTRTYDRYVEDIGPVFRDLLGRKVVSVHDAPDPVAVVREAQAIVVGGGNTWLLHRRLREEGLIEAIRERALQGVPYVGWSAGANVACPTIMTSNDMVITDPLDLAALALVPFQVNPHYLHGSPPGFHGETRENRIREFVELNRHVTVAGLREGLMLEVVGDAIRLLGVDDTARVFRYGEVEREVGQGDDLSFLLDPAQAVATLPTAP